MSAFENILKHLEAKKNSVFFGDQGEVELVVTGNKATVTARKGCSVVVNTTPTYKSENWCFDYEYSSGKEGSVKCRDEWFAFNGLASSMLENSGTSRQAIEKTTIALQNAFKSLFEDFRQKTMLVKKYSTAAFDSYSIAIWKDPKETYTDHLIVSHDLVQDCVFVQGIYSATDTRVTGCLFQRGSTLEKIKDSGAIKPPAGYVTEAQYELACQELKKIVDEVFAADALKSAA